jgi:hypothetical protein
MFSGKRFTAQSYIPGKHDPNQQAVTVRPCSLPQGRRDFAFLAPSQDNGRRPAKKHAAFALQKGDSTPPFMAYDCLVDPLTLSAAASAVLSLVDWKNVAEGLANDAAGDTIKNLLGRLKPSEREKRARQALGIFTEEFLSELEDKTPLASAIPGYRNQLKRLLEHAAPDITGWFRPETKDVDLRPVERMWGGLKLDPRPRISTGRWWPRAMHGTFANK